jgi:glycosyltransferase involved in cell wall biosynthesis
VHAVVTSSAQRRFVTFGRGHAAKGLRPAVAVAGATARPLRGLLPLVGVRANGVPWPVEPVPLEVHEPPIVGSAALLVGWKGQSVLLEALAQLPGVHGELAGGRLPTEGAYAEGLEARAAQTDLVGRVRLLGHVDAMEAMRGWDVAVLASLRPEAGPLAALEAMSLGLPVVATDHGGSAEYLSDGCGVLVPPGDASALAEGIRTALDAARRPDLAARARARVAHDHDRSVTLPAQYRAVVLGEV